MRKLSLNLFYFLIPIILIIGIVPVDKRAKYVGLKDDCSSRGTWMHDRVYTNNTPTDIVFIGSSKTINGINDERINAALANETVTNFGYCRFGRNLHYLLLQELLQQKQPKLLVLEIRESENRAGHPIFPFLAESKEAILPYPFFNKNVLKDIWTHLAYKVELLQETIYSNETIEPIRSSNFGYLRALGNANLADLNKNKLKMNSGKDKLTEFEENFHHHFAHHYLKKIATLCKKKKIELLLLNLPSYGSNRTNNQAFIRYKDYGRILLPPLEILDNKTNWFDVDHLNEQGAKQLSDWLSIELSAIVANNYNASSY
jgi:hypothetical protein